MNRANKVSQLREKLRRGVHSIGSWMQTSDSSVAEILGAAGFDWIAIDMEHGVADFSCLPNLCRAIELGGAIPLVRLPDDSKVSCKRALDAGAGGVVIPDVKSADHMKEICSFCCWPPVGSRGVGFSRANLFGKRFDEYLAESQSPLIIPMIESKDGLSNLAQIIDCEGVDGVFVGPYDLSASLGVIGEFESKVFVTAMDGIIDQCRKASTPAGIHVVQPEQHQLTRVIDLGFTLIAYSIDTVFLTHHAVLPQIGARHEEK